MRDSLIHRIPKIHPPSWGLVNQNQVRPLRQTEFLQQLSCDVVFGSPAANCAGTGVCRITARTMGSQSLTERKRNCQSAVSLLYPIAGGNGVSMLLTKAFLCVRLYKNHLRHGTLNMEHSCPIPTGVVKSLGLKFNELASGEYPVRETEGFLRIDFVK